MTDMNEEKGLDELNVLPKSDIVVLLLGFAQWLTDNYVVAGMAGTPSIEHLVKRFLKEVADESNQKCDE